MAHLEQAEALREAWGTTATWTHWLAEGFRLVVRFEDAARIARRALTQSRETSERGNEAWLLRLFGELDSQSDPPALSKAESHYEQALAVATELGMPPSSPTATSASARSTGARTSASRRWSTSPPRRRCTARWG